MDIAYFVNLEVKKRCRVQTSAMAATWVVGAEAQVLWNDPNASVKVFLRDESNTQVDRDTDGSGSPETVSAVAATSGRWSVGVRIQSGSIDYDVLVNTTQ